MNSLRTTIANELHFILGKILVLISICQGEYHVLVTFCFQAVRFCSSSCR